MRKGGGRAEMNTSRETIVGVEYSNCAGQPGCLDTGWVPGQDDVCAASACLAPQEQVSAQQFAELSKSGFPICTTDADITKPVVIEQFVRYVLVACDDPDAMTSGGQALNNVLEEMYMRWMNNVYQNVQSDRAPLSKPISLGP